MTEGMDSDSDREAGVPGTSKAQQTFGKKKEIIVSNNNFMISLDEFLLVGSGHLGAWGIGMP